MTISNGYTPFFCGVRSGILASMFNYKWPGKSIDDRATAWIWQESAQQTLKTLNL